MNTRQSKVKPVVVEVAIRNAIARRLRDHGITAFDTIANEVTVDLFGTRVVPTPDGVPTGFFYQGEHLDWPQGVDTRPITEDEARTYTRLFSLKWEDGLLEGETLTPPKFDADHNNANHLRTAYTTLWARVKTGKAPAESPAPAEVVRVWEPVASLPKNDGRAMAAAWEHLRVFGPTAVHDPAECLNTGTCVDPSPPLLHYFEGEPSDLKVGDKAACGFEVTLAHGNTSEGVEKCTVCAKKTRTLRTSDEWVALTGITVMDPDGWDRKDFERSWGERITRKEFDKRVSTSTCSHPSTNAERGHAVGVKAEKARKTARKPKVQPVVPEVTLSQFDQDMADLDALIDSL